MDILSGEGTLLFILASLLIGSLNSLRNKICSKMSKLSPFLELFKADFANSVDLDEVAHHEPPHLDLHYLPSSL